MSVISREEAMGNLKGNSCYECSCASYLGVQGCTYKFDCSFRDSINKAISDMEKLEKIEQIIFRRSDIKTEEQAKASMVVKFMEIEQIVTDMEKNMADFEVVLPRTTEEWQRDMHIAYNQALEDLKNNILEGIKEDKDFASMKIKDANWEEYIKAFSE